MTRAASTGVALATLGLASRAWAAGGGEAGGGSVLLWATLNLVLLLGVLFAFVRKPARAFFAERRDRVKGDLDQAARLRREAEQKLIGWQRKLTELDAELDRIRETARTRAGAERARILAEAEVAAERIRSEARAAIEHELRRAREVLRDEAADLAIELAAERLREAVTKGDRDRLLDEFIERIARGDSEPRGRSGAER